jgi:hypothetical protein
VATPALTHLCVATPVLSHLCDSTYPYHFLCGRTCHYALLCIYTCPHPVLCSQPSPNPFLSGYVHPRSFVMTTPVLVSSVFIYPGFPHVLTIPLLPNLFSLFHVLSSHIPVLLAQSSQNPMLPNHPYTFSLHITSHGPAHPCFATSAPDP